MRPLVRRSLRPFSTPLHSGDEQPSSLITPLKCGGHFAARSGELTPRNGNLDTVEPLDVRGMGGLLDRPQERLTLGERLRLEIGRRHPATMHNEPAAHGRVALVPAHLPVRSPSWILPPCSIRQSRATARASS